jgi:hypothetical protein
MHVLPESITTIGVYAFSMCNKMQTINLPNSLTQISDYIFYECSCLQAIVIPESVVEIDDAAFAYCSALQRIEVNAINPPVIYEATFAEVDKTIEVLVPRKSVDAYKAADYWKEFINYKELSSIDDTTNGEVNIRIDNGTLVIEGVDGKTVVNIYSLSGVLLHNTIVEQVNDITLPQGIYIVVIGNDAYKVVI